MENKRKFEIGDVVVIRKDANEESVGVYYNIGAVGIIIENDEQDSLDVRFYEGEYDMGQNGEWWIKGASLDLKK